jgi:hypothetical protein
MEWNRLDTPLRIARALWSLEGRELAPAAFRELFERAYREANDLETLWQLGGAINDFLRHRPGTLEVPPQLPWRLLQSDDVEARVIGLKLLNRIDVSDAERIEELARAIECHDGYESVGGLHELGQFLEGRQNSGQKIPAESVNRLRRVLEDFPRDDGQDYRAWVAHLVRFVKEPRS